MGGQTFRRASSRKLRRGSRRPLPSHQYGDWSAVAGSDWKQDLVFLCPGSEGR
jgi:hypothetical protein